MSARINQCAKVPRSFGGMRLDQVAAEMFPEFSRARLQGWIKEGSLLVDQRSLKPKAKVAGGEILELDAEIESQEAWLPEQIEIDHVYEDEHILVINKPAGLVVHPGAGNWSGTLLNGLLYHLPDLTRIPRAGIVHRLDKDTSGLMVVAKTVAAQVNLVDQLQQRSVSRTYWALVIGEPPESGIIERAIGRHPSQRTKMAVLKSGGKEAITHFRSLKRFTGYSLLECKLETGRTHQIRVHMADLGFPLVGDPVYGGLVSSSAPELIKTFKRQALHAKSLGLVHPEAQDQRLWEVALVDDMQVLIEHLARI